MKTLLIAMFAASMAGTMMASSTAHAGTVGAARSDAGGVYLYDEPRSCVDGAWYAQWRAKDGTIVDGCWRARQDGMVQAVFMDADIALIPFEAIKQPEVM